MNIQEYKELLLLNIPTAIEAGCSEVVCKCFDCPDDGDHHHMYISIPQTEDELSFYNCFKCGSKGVVNSKTLMKWNIYDIDFNVLIQNHNRSAFSNPKNFRYTLDGVCNLNYNSVTINKYTTRKLEFINERLGTNLTIDECIPNKIVLSIYDILNQNRNAVPTRHKAVLDSLDKYFVGLLSYDNNFINMKNLVYGKGVLYEKLDELRYINYNIFNKMDNSMKYIVSPVQFNMQTKIKVHLTEGPFDMLSVKYNLRNNEPGNLFIAVGGNGFKGVIRNLITVNKLINMEIHLYPDNEIAKGGRPSTQMIINDFVNYIRPFGFDIYIHLNMKGKDMGESLDKIEEYTYKI